MRPAANTKARHTHRNQHYAPWLCNHHRLKTHKFPNSSCLPFPRASCASFPANPRQDHPSPLDPPGHPRSQPRPHARNDSSPHVHTLPSARRSRCHGQGGGERARPAAENAIAEESGSCAGCDCGGEEGNAPREDYGCGGEVESGGDFQQGCDCGCGCDCG